MGFHLPPPPTPGGPDRRRRHGPATLFTGSSRDVALHQVASPEGQVHEIAVACAKSALACASCKSAVDVQLESVLAPIRARREALAAQPSLVRTPRRPQTVRLL